jgi:two-component system, NtrC family, nitrogen regulation sensor histidine kinase GlnL
VTSLVRPDPVSPEFAGFEVLSTGVILLDGARSIVYANPAAENLFEISERQLVGHSLRTVFGDSPALTAAIGKAVASGAAYTEQELELAAPGKVKLHLNATVSPVEMSRAALLIEFRHIDQQLKIAREERLLEQHQANRELVRSLAHEIKNPLGGIRGAAQLLERELPGPELREFTQVIVKEADRLQSLMNRLLTPSRLPQIEMINVHEVMERVRTLVLAEHPEGLAVRRDYDVSLPDLPGDRESLIQAVLNVARNTAQAMSGRGQIAFRTRIARQVTIAKTRYRLAARIEIEDNGPGVPESLADKIFYPLVTGREGGSGLGLSLAQSYVHQHHGLIEFESVPGRTCFTILLPVRSPAEAGLARPPSEGEKP